MAFCGCAIAAGSGMACAIAYLKGGGVKEMEYVLNNRGVRGTVPLTIDTCVI